MLVEMGAKTEAAAARSHLQATRTLIKALRRKPATSFPVFEQLFGWPLAPGVVPFADMLSTDRLPEIATEWYVRKGYGPSWLRRIYDDSNLDPAEIAVHAPWSSWTKLARDPDAVLDRLLFGPRAAVLFTGLTFRPERRW